MSIFVVAAVGFMVDEQIRSPCCSRPSFDMTSLYDCSRVESYLNFTIIPYGVVCVFSRYGRRTTPPTEEEAGDEPLPPNEMEDLELHAIVAQGARLQSAIHPR